MLTKAQVEDFRRDGYLAPLNALGSRDVAGAQAKLAAYEAANGPLGGSRANSPHLLFTWVDELIRHPAILAAVEDIIGPDILVRGSTFFIKQPRDPRFVSWHQDSVYWGLEPQDVVTAWVALSESTAANGALRVVPGSHRKKQIPHRETPDPNNMLSRGQELAVAVNSDEVVTLELAPGQMSLHHVLLVHGSEPNPSDRRRVGLAIRYMPTYVRQHGGEPDPATLVHGTDTFHHFPPALRPKADLAPEAIAYHDAMLRGRTEKAGARAAKVQG